MQPSLALCRDHLALPSTVEGFARYEVIEVLRTYTDR